MGNEENYRRVAYAALANDGKNPLTDHAIFDAQYVRDMLTVMNSCGMYNFAGQWSYEVGMPAKSGVGGGIIAVSPGKFGIAVISPPLDEAGNTLLKNAMEKIGLSARAYDRILKVARTVADLDRAEFLQIPRQRRLGDLHPVATASGPCSRFCPAAGDSPRTAVLQGPREHG